MQLCTFSKFSVPLRSYSLHACCRCVHVSELHKSFGCFGGGGGLLKACCFLHKVSVTVKNVSGEKDMQENGV